MTTITEFQIVDHGIEGEQYFQGCGVSFTSFEHVATGCGDTFAEAIDDALEMMAQGEECKGVDFEALEKVMLADYGADKWPANVSASGLVSWDADDETDTHYYVSVRYNVAEVKA